MTRKVHKDGKKHWAKKKTQWLFNQPITTKNQRVKNQARQNQWTKNQSENHWGEKITLSGPIIQ